MKKFIVNPVTGNYESTSYTFGDRFDLKNEEIVKKFEFQKDLKKQKNQFSTERTVKELQKIIDNAPPMKIGDKLDPMNAKDLTGESEASKRFNPDPNKKNKGIEYLTRKEIDKFGAKGTNELVFKKTNKHIIKTDQKGKYAVAAKRKSKIIPLQGTELSYKGDSSLNFIHPYPKVQPTTLKTTGIGDARINRSLSGYDKIAQPIGEAQVELVKNKANMSSDNFNKERMKLNAQAKQARDDIVSKKGNITKNYTGYYRINESGTTLEPKGFNAKQSFAGIKGKDKKFIDMTKDELTQFKEEKLNYDKKIKTLRNFGDSIKSKGLNLFSKLEKGSPSRKIFETLVPGKLDAVVLTPYDFITSMAAGYNLPESVVIAASNLLPKAAQKMLPTTLAVYENQKGFDGTNPFHNMGKGEETKIGKKIRTSLEDAVNKIKDKFGDSAIGTADEAPESEAAEKRRLIEDFNNRNSIDIPEIDDQYMAAEGGRVNFSEGSPNPDSDFLKMTMAARENENIPFNPIKNFNEIINPKAFAGYAQKIVSGAMKLPEYATRLIPAGGSFASDLIKGQKNALGRFAENMQPKATEALIEKIGLQKMIDESDAKATGSQKYYGDMLELGTELLGPATAIGYFTAAGKLTKSGIKELQRISGKNFPKIKAQMEEKISAAGESRRDFNKTVAVGGMIGLAKVLGLDSLLTTTAKVASKVPAKIVTAGGTPQYFFDFVSLIRKSGNDVSDKAATLERQKVYDYKGYTMVEDLSTGEIKINKTNEGVGSGTDDLGETQIYDKIDSQDEILYKPSETIQGKDGKAIKTLDEYEEATASPDMDGDIGDGEVGLNSIDEILELLSKDGKKYNLKELEEMGLNPSGLGQSGLKKILKDPAEINLLKRDDMFKDTLNRIKYKTEKGNKWKIQI